MSRFTLAFRCFFRLIFGASLPAVAVRYLPEDAHLALPEPVRDGADERGATSTDDSGDGDATAAKDAAKDAAAGKGAATAQRPKAKAAVKADQTQPADQAKPARTSSTVREHHRDGALALLALMQREGRLVDFLQESLDDHDDSEIGASVREIHRGLHKVLSEHLEIEPVMPGDEDADVSIPAGFDPAEVRLIGDVSGDPPFSGVLRHHGWRVTSVSLPALSEGVDRHVLAPAEVEIS